MASTAGNREGLRPGLHVFARSGEPLGVVKQVEEDRFQIDRKMMPDLWLTITAVGDVRDEKVILNAHTYELDDYAVSR